MNPNTTPVTTTNTTPAGQPAGGWIGSDEYRRLMAESAAHTATLFTECIDECGPGHKSGPCAACPFDEEG